MKILAKYLKDKRTSAKLSQSAVAEKLGYSTPQFISNWERGVSHPPVKSLRKIADLYKISADELFEVLLKAVLTKVAEDLRRQFKR